MAEYFASPHDYIQTATSITDKIKKIDEIIEAMMTSSLAGASTSDIEEIQVNTGQSIVKNIFRNPNEVTNGLLKLETLRNYYESKLTGRVKRCQDNTVIPR